jgi:acetyl esterase/lipase
MPARVLNDPLFYGDQPSQFVEFRRPPAAATAPLAIMIHGGFWRVRYGLEHADKICDALAAAGFVTANLEYRRVGEHGGGWPGTLQDVRNGVTFARDRAAQFGGDASRTVVLGHSAGGHLALWVAAEIPDLRRVIGLGPVANLQLAYTLGLSQCAVAEFLGGTPADVPQRYAEADPARATPVPRVLIHGDADDIVPVELTRQFEALATRIEIPGADHFAIIDPGHSCWPVVLREARA